MIGGRGIGPARIVYGRPVSHRLPSSGATQADGEHYGLWIPFDLVVPSFRVRCTAVYLRVAFDNPEVTGVDIRSGTDLAPPVPDLPGWAERMRTVPDPGPVSVSGVGERTIGIFAGDFDDRGSPLPRSYAIHVVARAPHELHDLTGTLRVDASFVQGRLRSRVVHARSEGTQRFTAPLARNPPRDAAGVRLCMAADIERYSRFANPDAVTAQVRLTTALARARRYAGIDEDLVINEESGDGQFAILPIGLDESVVIPQLVEGLRDALADVNRDAGDRIRIRLALHRGHVAPGANGWVGSSTIAIHRLLDSAPVRTALTRHPPANFALIVPDSLFTDVIAHRYGRLAPESFDPVDVEVPAKNFSERAWVHVPG